MIPYVGGKSTLANWIISNFPDNYNKIHYCEIFGGGGWVLFKKEPSYIETYNDLNNNLVTLFTIIRDNFAEFQQRCDWTLHSRTTFEDARDKLKDDKFLNDIERALNYAVSKIQSFGGKGDCFGYSLTTEKIKRGQWAPFVRRLAIINARLKYVQIECLDFEKCIEKYDRPGTLFYLDPPYIDTEDYYNKHGVVFQPSDHKRLAGLLKQIQGKFCLSYYDNPLARKLYKKFRIIEKTSIKSLCGGSRKRPKSHELLIMNY